MWPYIVRFFSDETKFVGICRAIIGGLGLAIDGGKLPLPEGWDWIGLWIVALAFMMRSASSAYVPVEAEPIPETDDEPTGSAGEGV